MQAVCLRRVAKGGVSGLRLVLEQNRSRKSSFTKVLLSGSPTVLQARFKMIYVINVAPSCSGVPGARRSAIAGRSASEPDGPTDCTKKSAKC